MLKRRLKLPKVGSDPFKRPKCNTIFCYCPEFISTTRSWRRKGDVCVFSDHNVVDIPVHNLFFKLCFYTATMGGKTYTKRLIAVERVSTFWSFLEGLLEELGACENLFSGQPLAGPCPKCIRQRQMTPSGSGAASHSKYLVATHLFLFYFQ